MRAINLRRQHLFSHAGKLNRFTGGQVSTIVLANIRDLAGATVAARVNGKKYPGHGRVAGPIELVADTTPRPPI